MDLKKNKISPIDFHVSIKDWLFESTQKDNPIYKILVNYMKEGEKKNWTVEKNYEEFEILHTIFLKKFKNTPYLPLKITPVLKDTEQKERVKLLEVYLNICLKNLVMLNSIEMRLFLEIEENLKLYIQPLQLIGDLELDDNYPIACEFWAYKKIFFVLTSDDDLEEGSMIGKAFSLLWGKKYNKGTLYILREKYQQVHEYEIKGHQDFEKSPTCLATNEQLEFLVVGFKDGHVESYFFKQNNKLELTANTKTRSTSILDLYCLDNHPVYVIFGNQYFSFSQINEGHFEHDVAHFSCSVTAFLYAPSNSILFLGDQKGNLHIYQFDSSNFNFQLLSTQSLKAVTIVGLGVSKNNRYLFITFKDGSIEIYDLGVNFSSKPNYTNIYQHEALYRQSKMLTSEQQLVINSDKGQLIFMHQDTMEADFQQALHDGVIKDFQIDLKQRLIFTVGLDKRTKIWQFENQLTVEEFPKKREFRYFCYDLIDACIPSKFPQKKSKVEDKEFDLKADVKKEAEQKIRRIEESSESEEDLSNWDQFNYMKKLKQSQEPTSVNKFLELVDGQGQYQQNVLILLFFLAFTTSPLSYIAGYAFKEPIFLCQQHNQFSECQKAIACKSGDYKTQYDYYTFTEKYNLECKDYVVNNIKFLSFFIPALSVFSLSIMMDIFGRLIFLKIGILTSIISTLMALFAQTIEETTIALIIAHLSIDLISSVVYVYFSETMTGRLRNISPGLTFIGYAGSNFLMTFLISLFKDVFIVFKFTLTMNILFLLTLYYFIETPFFLNKKKPEQLLDCLVYIGKLNGHSSMIPVIKDEILKNQFSLDKLMDEEHQGLKLPESNHKEEIKDILRSVMLILSIYTCAYAFILEPQHMSPFSLMININVSTFGEILGYIIVSRQSEFLKRKKFFRSFLICLLILPILANVFSKLDFYFFDFMELLVCLFAKILCGGAYALIYTYITELVSTSIRSMSLGILILIGRLGGSFVSYIIDYLVKHNIHPLTFLLPLSLASLVTMRRMPETLGQKIKN